MNPPEVYPPAEGGQASNFEWVKIKRQVVLLKKWIFGETYNEYERKKRIPGIGGLPGQRDWVTEGK